MYETIQLGVSISFITISMVFYLLALYSFKINYLTRKNGIKTKGTLVGFRKYYTSDEWGDNSVDYSHNSRGFRPIVNISIDGETVSISSVTPNLNLNKDDIGKTFKTIYRRGIGIKLIIDDEDSVEKYEKHQRILISIYTILATSFLIFGIVSYFYVSNLSIT